MTSSEDVLQKSLQREYIKFTYQPDWCPDSFLLLFSKARGVQTSFSFGSHFYLSITFAYSSNINSCPSSKSLDIWPAWRFVSPYFTFIFPCPSGFVPRDELLASVFNENLNYINQSVLLPCVLTYSFRSFMYSSYLILNFPFLLAHVHSIFIFLPRWKCWTLSISVTNNVKFSKLLTNIFIKTDYF